MKVSAILGMGILGVALMVGTGMGGGEAKKETKEGKAKGFLPQGWKNLELSADQKEKIYKLQAEYKAKYDDLKDKEKDLKSKERGDLVKLLTEAQKEQLRKLAVGEATKKDAKTDEKK